MIKSMTGYGRGQSDQGEGSWVVEIKTVNSRYLDFHLRLPPGLTALEERIKKFIGARLTRGRINLSIAASGAVGAAPRLVLNKPLVREYQRVLAELQQELGISQEPGIMPFLHNRDLILSQEEGPDPEALWQQIEPALAAALDEVEQMRAAEGHALAEDLRARLEVVGSLFQQAADRSPEVVAAYAERLSERIAVLTADTEPDPQRLALEVAVIADKADITEEAVRAASHIEQLKAFLGNGEPVGRKLDFLLQEMNREANTMGSKTPDAAAGQVIVELKAELERIREQVQNIE